MKKIKKILAFLLSVCIIVPNAHIVSYAADIDDDVDIESVEITEAVEAAETEETKEQEIYINYLVLTAPNLVTPDTQNVLIGINNERENIDDAILYYRNENNGVQYQANAKNIDSESVLFEMDFADSSVSGKYVITAVAFVSGDELKTINLEETGINACFGVNEKINSEADAYVDESGSEEKEAAGVIVSENGEITTYDFENAVIEASEGAVMANKAHENIVVVLDPGHGTPNGDTGATYTWNGVTYIERDINLKIAQYCKDALERYKGVKVYMTRTTNNNGLTLGPTEGSNIGPLVKYADDLEADIFVSIHINAATSNSANGAEVYYPNANYNPEMSSSTRNLSNKILEKLAACGLTNRGAKIRDDSGNIRYYPDGSLSDYYGVIRQSKLCGFPGIIIEHAFVTNQYDAEKFLGTEVGLQKLGYADATAIAEYFGLTTTDDAYKPGDASLYAVQNNADGSFTVVTSGVGDVSRVVLWATSLKTGQEMEYGSIPGGDGSWYSRFDVNDFMASGSYLLEAYVPRENGTFYKVGETTITVECAENGKIQTKNVNHEDGTFDVVVSGIESPNGISKVTFGVGLSGNMRDETMYNAEKQDDGTYIAHISTANHKSKYGVFDINCYVTDNKGVKVIAAVADQEIKMPEPKVSAFDVGDENTYILIGENLPSTYDVKSVKFGVWNEGLSDLRWYEAGKDEYGRWLALFSLSDYGKGGTYYMDAYATLKNGQSVKFGSGTFTVSAPKGSTIYVNNVNKNTGTFDVVVAGVSTYDVSSIRIPVWSAHDLSDLHWYNAEKQSNGTYIAHANIKNHKYNYGVYAMQAYVKNKNGVENIAASTCYKIEEPVAQVSTFKCDNEFNYILIAEDIPRSDTVVSVKFGVWNEGLSDLRWYEAGKDEYGRWLAVVGVPQYGKSGTYCADAYAILKDGSSVKIGGTSFNVSAPTANRIYAGNPDNSGGTFDIIIEGVNAVAGVESIKVPVWSENNLTDLYWYDAEDMGNGTYIAHADIRNHKNHYATYAMQAYIKSQNGIQVIAASNCYSFKQPTEMLYGIMGTSMTDVNQMVRYYNSMATYPEYYKTTDAPTIEDLCKIYIEECEAEGVRAEVAFCQAMKETGFLRFGGKVEISQFNFAGIGATDDGGTPASFNSVREGVRAQVQHLKAYASDKQLVNACVDPRFKLVTRGTAPYVEWLGIQENPYGKGWASAKNYGYSMKTGYIEILLSK